MDSLARDPSHGNKITDQGLKERAIGLELEERGELERIIRDPQADKGAEFIDQITGLKWDIKSFESYPNGHNVIIDTRKLVPEHITQLRQAIDAAGIGNRIIWYP